MLRLPANSRIVVSPSFSSLRCSLLLLLVSSQLATAVAAQEEPSKPSPPFNGFDLEKCSVPRDKILEGGPARDGVPRVDSPEYVSAREASWVRGDTPVIGVKLGGQARAVPIHLIEYHQVVNDEIAGVPVLITYDPISGTPIAFRSSLDGKRMSFGVSGLIYNSNFLLYDLETRSLWSQFLGRAIAGPMAGRELVRLRVRQEPFGVWIGREPLSKVLARPLPQRIDYRYSPYSRYWISETVPFPVEAKDDRYHPKEVVLGVEVKGVTRAYLGSVLTALGGRIVDEIAGHKIRIAYESEVGSFIWEAPEAVEVSDAYWFSWKAFHPETQIWSASDSDLTP